MVIKQMSLELIETASELRSLSDEWNSLPEAASNPLLSYDWFEACAAATEPLTKIMVAVLREHGKIRAIAPLAIGRRHGVATLEFLGWPGLNLCEPCDLLYADEEVLASLVEELKGLGKPLFLSRIPTESPTAALLSDSLTGMTSIPLRTRSRSLFVPISGEWEDFEAGLPSSRRAKLRQRLKAAKKFGEVSFEVVRPTSATHSSFLDQFMSIEVAGWKGTNGTAVEQKPAQKQFFKQYFGSLSSKDQFVVFLMRINGEVMAMRLAVEYGRRLWELKITYNEDYKKCAPGRLLTHETIRYAFEQGLEGHEFLGEEEDWERIWTDSSREYRLFGLYPRSTSGMLSMGMFAAQYATNKAGRLLTSLTR
ncbi:MAG: GNAT family N-acetyltransferase [Geminicoccales bacterium]